MVLLIDACSMLGDYAPMMRALLTFGSYTLLRPCELRALDWPGIDLDAGIGGRATIPETEVEPAEDRHADTAGARRARRAARAARLLPGRAGVPQQDRRAG